MNVSNPRTRTAGAPTDDTRPNTPADDGPTRLVDSPRPSRPVADRVHRLSRGQMWAVGAAVTLGLTVAEYGFAGSYLTISTLAAQHELPLPELVPAGIDGGLVAVVVLDLVLAWTGRSVGWLRQLVRLLSMGTIAANVVGGWPDPVAVGMHVAAPMMVLAMVEAGRTVLLRFQQEVLAAMRERGLTED